MHLAPLIRDLAVILGVAGLMSLLFQRIKQPVVLGYIIAGMIVGPYTPPVQLITDIPSIQTWAELGVIFLMFSLGLEFSFRKLARVGASAGITAGAEVLFFLPVGYGVGQLFGWSSMDSIFLGAMLSISSTTIIIKALDELKLKSHKFSELIFGTLIVEDLIAILLLVALTTVATTETVSAMGLLTAVLKLILVVGGWFITGYFVLPRFMRYVGRVGNNEMITLLSLGLCLGLVVFASTFHYSAALGAFIMGSILAESSVIQRIEQRIEPLRDLFGAVFFVSIGMLIDPRMLWEHRWAVLILCAVTIVGKIVSTGAGALASGQTFRNSVRVGFGLAQIGEFSFIIAGVGLTLKATSDFIYPIAVAVSLVTTFTTPYLIRYSGPCADWLERKLPRGLIERLNSYALWSERRRAEAPAGDSNLLVKARWVINGLTLSVIFVLSRNLLLPELSDRGMTGYLSSLLSWGAAALLSAPFIWAMLTTFQKHRNLHRPPGDKRSQISATVIVSQVLTLVWIGALSASFFPGRYVLLAAVTGLLLFFVVFYRRLEIYYHWYETSFLAAFDAEGHAHSSVDRLSHLAPWDAHLVKIQVHPNSALVMKQLKDAELRTRWGINVVAIQRGLETLVAPKPDAVMLPGDELIVLGTDEQVGSARQEFEAAPALAGKATASSTYELSPVKLPPGSRLVGHSIRQCGIRENYHSMVVGIERDGHRNINPDSDLRLQAEDTLWLVGEKAELAKLQSFLLHSADQAPA